MIGRKHALVGQVVDGHHASRLVARHEMQVRRPQPRLPVVAVQDLRPPADRRVRARQDRGEVGQQAEAQLVVGPVLAGGVLVGSARDARTVAGNRRSIAARRPAACRPGAGFRAPRPARAGKPAGPSISRLPSRPDSRASARARPRPGTSAQPGSEPLTSASPPVLISGATSEVTNRTACLAAAIIRAPARAPAPASGGRVMAAEKPSPIQGNACASMPPALPALLPL